MVKVEKCKDESDEKFLQRFKRAVNKDGVLKDLKRRSRYEKPSERRRRKQKERIKALRKAERKKREGHVFKSQKDRRVKRNNKEW